MLAKICKNTNGKEKISYYCEFCDYKCSTKFLYNQHLSTKKHEKSKMLGNARKNMQKYVCDCGKNYLHKQSYNRHVKRCQGIKKNEIVEKTQNQVIEEPTEDTEKEELRGMIKQLIVQNQNMLMENKEMREMVGEMIPKIGNNNTTIQNKFSLQIFLNETCKDAINLTDFVNTLDLQLDDLDNTRQHGFITGIADIFVRGLKQLELNKRPIHCSDLKREVLYVKDNDSWGRDKNNMKQAISDVAKKQIDKIKEWEQEHPNWNKTETGTTEYIEMIRNVTNTGTEENNENKIIKTIAKEVLIDKI
tara:strand:+ start:1080 stop:1991 length:912 start_codon:yes stop_codon:yes gene_type:complete